MHLLGSITRGAVLALFTLSLMYLLGCDARADISTTSRPARVLDVGYGRVLIPVRGHGAQCFILLNIKGGMGSASAGGLACFELTRWMEGHLMQPERELRFNHVEEPAR